MKKTYQVLFWIIGILSVLITYGFASYLLASFGHATEPWGWWIRFNHDAVLIEPPIECLSFSNSHTLQVYNILIPVGCCDEVRVNNQGLIDRGTNYGPCQWYNLTYVDNKVTLEINDKVVVAHEQNNRTLVFEAEYKNKTSIVSIPIYVQNGTMDKLRNLMIIFSPALAAILLFSVYLFREKPEIAILKRVRKVLIAVIVGIAIFLILLVSPTVLPEAIQPLLGFFIVMAIFSVAPFLVLIFPFLLILLIITQIVLWMKKRETNHHQKHKI